MRREFNAKHQPFGTMTDLVIAMRHRGIPMKALDLSFFLDKEEEMIRAAYDMTYSEFAQAIAPPPDDVDRAIASVVSEIKEVA